MTGPTTRATEAWQCDRCLSVHDAEELARECCPPVIHEGYVCTECDDFHEDRDAAEQCCAPTESGDMAPAAWQRHIERLEEMGQQRLVP